MTEIKRLFNQSSHYLAGRVLGLVAGLISFPILTRIFSVDDYGILGLLNTTLFLAVAISKFGLQESVIRFYAEFRERKELKSFFFTLMLSSVVGALIGSSILILTARLLVNHMDERTRGLLYLVAVLVFLRCTVATLTSFLRAEERSKLYNVGEVAIRYGSLGVGIFLVFFWVKGLSGFYVGMVFSWGVFLLILLYLSRDKFLGGCSGFSWDILKDSFMFGFPLVWAEFGHLLLTYADRYMIQIYMGTGSVGLYTAGYNLAMYVSEAIVYPMDYARGPISMVILAEKGEEALREFLAQAFRLFLMILIPCVLGFIAVGRDLMSLLASTKYLEAHTILPYVILGQAIYGCSLSLNAGLFLRKKTRRLTLLIMAGVLLNVGLNVLLIPRFGIVGAAQATLLSGLVHTLAVTYFSFREFAFRIDYSHILRYLAAGIAMYFVVGSVDLGSTVLNLAGKMLIGTLIYVWMVLMLDGDVRRWIALLIARRRRMGFTRSE